MKTTIYLALGLALAAARISLAETLADSFVAIEAGRQFGMWTNALNFRGDIPFSATNLYRPALSLVPTNGGVRLVVDIETAGSQAGPWQPVTSWHYDWPAGAERCFYRAILVVTPK